MAGVRVATPELERIEVLLSSSELERIDDWRSELQVGSREDAIRRLIKLGLKASGGDGAPAPIVTPKASSSSR